MAFGLGFDKAKILQAAEKYTVQGKIPAAIEEYQKIVKKDPKDLMTLNAIGDLYVRAGKMEDALKTFHLLAEKSVEGGAVPRAIAVYKRITKIDPESLVALEKLGELYSMQGLMRDARTYFLQAVEIYSKRKEPEKARAVFERVLMLDMDNPKLLKRMGDFYVETRKEDEAISTYLSAAERYLDGNAPDEAMAVLEAIYKLDPINEESIILKGRALLDQGKAGESIAALESIRDYQRNKTALNALFHAYVKQDNAAKTEEVANQLLDLHGDMAGLDVLTAGLLDRNDTHGALAVYQRVAERLQGQGGLGSIAEGLRRILDRDSKNKQALELIWTAYRQSMDVDQGRHIGERLAQVHLEEGEPAKAREVYVELVAAEPDNHDLVQQLRRIDARYSAVKPQGESNFGDISPLMAMEEAAETGITSDHVGALAPREKALVKNCLTESELYLTYHQLPKAIETLETGLVEVPGDIALYEHLLPLYEQTQDYEKALQAAEALTEAYVRMGNGDRASRYGELLLGYQTKIFEAANSGAPRDVAAGVPSETVHLEQSQVREVDLSMEWASLSSAPSATATTDSLVEQIEFYLQASLGVEAEESVGKLHSLDPSHGSLSDLRYRLDVLLGRGAAVAEVAIPDFTAAGSEISSPEVSDWVEPAAAEAVIPEPVFSTPDAFVMPAQESAPEPPSEAELDLEHLSAGPSGADLGFELALDDQSMAVPLGVPSTPTMPASPSKAGGGMLDDLFAEFRDEVEEPQPGGGGDLETHYNMGVAFKEMALYDEAIGEFQKVHQIAEAAKDYSHLVQCCSLLAICFIEKGLPLLAVNWYRTALDSPGADAESELALHYEIGAAYELAGNRSEALKSFMDVYSRNIDYRNVAERIRELQQGS